MDNGDIDSFFEGFSAMSAGEQFETLLGYFNAELSKLPTEAIRAFRGRALEKLPEVAAKATVLEVIDGLLALRAIEEGGAGNPRRP